jgi:hypothetical protein
MKSEMEMACDKLMIGMSITHKSVDTCNITPRDVFECVLMRDGKSDAFEYSTRSRNVRYKGKGYNDELTRGMNIALGACPLRPCCPTAGPDVDVYEWYGDITIGDVMCYLLDSYEATTLCFDPWCIQNNLSNDSISALSKYLAAQREGARLIKVLGNEALKVLNDCTHEKPRDARKRTSL